MAFYFYNDIIAKVYFFERNNKLFFYDNAISYGQKVARLLRSESRVVL